MKKYQIKEALLALSAQERTSLLQDIEREIDRLFEINGTGA